MIGSEKSGRPSDKVFQSVVLKSRAELAIVSSSDVSQLVIMRISASDKMVSVVPVLMISESDSRAPRLASAAAIQPTPSHTSACCRKTLAQAVKFDVAVAVNMDRARASALFSLLRR